MSEQKWYNSKIAEGCGCMMILIGLAIFGTVVWYGKDIIALFNK